MLKESSEDLLIQEFDNLQISRLKKELEVAVDDLEKANERLYLLRVKLEDKDKALEDNYTKLNTLKQKLTEYEPDREDLNKSSVPDFESDNTLILWIILIIALSTGFYFYNEKLKVILSAVLKIMTSSKMRSKIYFIKFSLIKISIT